jgi:transcription antitermination protein NusB
MQNENQNPPNENNSPLNPIARRNARRYALQALYQWQMAGANMHDIESEFFRYHIDKPLDKAYFNELIYGILEEKSSIDDTMQPFLGRPLNELDPIELAVLRVATYELLKRPDVPYRVIINEALELTKKFGSVEGHKFVNGVLDRIARKIRSVEINMKK